MDAEVDLTAASREDLLAIIADLQRRVEELEARLAGGGRPRGMPGNKPGRGHGRWGDTSKPRKPRSRGFGRRRMEPTDHVEHALDICPDCGTSLTGGWVHRTREVIEIPAMPVQVTQHVVVARTCRVCREAAGAEAGAGRRGGGPSAVGYQSCESGGNAQGACQAADRHDPVVPADGSRIGPERRGDSGDDPPCGRGGAASGGRYGGPHPRQPGGLRRRDGAGARTV